MLPYYDYSKGKAIIIVNTEFTDWRGEKHQIGSVNQAQDFQVCLEDSHFEVALHKNFSSREIYKVLQEEASKEFQHDCFLLAFITHGCMGGINGSDGGFVPEQTILQYFMYNQSMAGKPKVFIFESCRGVNKDIGVKVLQEVKQGGPASHIATSSDDYITIPTTSDIIRIYSTFDGFSSFTSDEGTPFINYLRKELSSSKEDLITILTEVNRKVGIEFSSSHDTDPTHHEKKLAPNFSSSLTKKLFFHL